MSKKSLGVELDKVELDKTVEFTWNDEQFVEVLPGKLELSKLTPTELKKALNRVPAEFAYWSAILSDITSEVDKLQVKYDIWYAEMYFTVDKAEPKKTEGWKKNKILLDNAKKVKSYYGLKSNLALAKGKVSALVKAYDIQSRTLQTIAGFMKAELAMVQGSSKSL